MASNSNLLAMGLTPQDASDEHIRFGNNAKRATLMESVKITEPSLAEYSSLWKKEATTSVAKASAVVIGGHADGVQDKPLAARYYLCKDETAAWAKKYLKFSIENSNNKVGLRSTAPSDTYDVKQYDKYIPQMVRDAAAKYITKFYNHYIGRNPKLTEDMITLCFTSFMCCELLGEQRAIDEHVEDIHGFTNGVDDLKENQIIQVDSKIAFTLPSLLDIELLGPAVRGIDEPGFRS